MQLLASWGNSTLAKDRAKHHKKIVIYTLNIHYFLLKIPNQEQYMTQTISLPALALHHWPLMG
jgi:hypothetical protein